jgi:TRAP-type C4-dicarboxylate transport system permease small subunit
MSVSAQPARLLGIPLGDFGLFSAILLSLASGFLAFFASCFLAIVGLLFWNQLGHHTVNYADSYRYIAFPIGLVVLAFGFLFFMGTWLRRRLSGNPSGAR